MASGTASSTTDPPRLRPASWLQRSLSATVDLLFPPRCAACAQECESRVGEPLLCSSCDQNLAISPRPMCPRCASICSQADLPRGDCGDCRSRKLLFAAARAIGPYEGELRQAVLRGKQAIHGALGAAVGQRLSEAIERKPFAERPDLVVPVPMHWLKRLWRGINPAASIAHAVARQLHLPSSNVLVCRRLLRRQATLTAPQRRRNVRGAFCVSLTARVRGRRVLLIDDVMTTGATAHEASRALLKAGATAVYVATVARSSAVP